MTALDRFQLQAFAADPGAHLAARAAIGDACDHYPEIARQLQVVVEPDVVGHRLYRAGVRGAGPGSEPLKIKEGKWIEGREYVRSPDGGLVVDQAKRIPCMPERAAARANSTFTGHAGGAYHIAVNLAVPCAFPPGQFFEVCARGSCQG